MFKSGLVICIVLIGSVSPSFGDPPPADLLLPVYAPSGDVLYVYGDAGLTDLVTRVGSGTLLTIDGFIDSRGGEGDAAHVAAPERLTGYVAKDKIVEVMAVWADTLNVREGDSLSSGALFTASRGAVVIYREPTVGSPNFSSGEDEYMWRHCTVDGTKGWLAENYVIEKCFFDALEPALELYDAGDLPGMRSYLEELDRRYGDVECEIAADGRTAAVAFRRKYSESDYIYRLFIVGEPDTMVFSNLIDEYYISDGGRYTFVLYNWVSYGWGYSIEDPYTVLDNQTGEEVLDGSAYPFSFYHLQDDDATVPPPCAEFVDERYLLLVTHHGLPDDEYSPAYPYLEMLDLTTGESLVLLEPDTDWFKARSAEDYQVYDGVKMRRTAECSSPSAAVQRAMDTELFRRCEDELVRGLVSEA